MANVWYSFGQEKDIIEFHDKGSINWTQQYVEAKGESFIDKTKFPLEGQAVGMAKRGAIADAHRNLLEIVQGVQITSTTTVKDLVTQSDDILLEVTGLVKGAREVGEPEITSSSVIVTYRLPLYSNDGIGPIVIDKIREKDTSIPVQVGTSNIGLIDSNLIYTLNFNGKQVTPSMFPKIVDENGKLILDLSTCYDKLNGKYPQYVQLTKLGLKALQKKGKTVEFIDAVMNSEGKIQIKGSAAEQARKWGSYLITALKTAGTVASLFIL